MNYDDSRLKRLIGQLFLHARKQRGCSQDSVCKSIGIKTLTLRNIEKGKTSARLAYLCQLFLELFDFDLDPFIINYFLAQASDKDFKNIPWRNQDDNQALINLYYRQVNYDHLQYLILDQLKIKQINSANKADQTHNNTAQQLTFLNQMRGKHMDRRSTLFGLSSGIVSGPALTENLQGWLQAFDKNTPQGQKNLSQAMGKLGVDEVESLKLAARKLYESKMNFGGGPNRRIAIALLHEVWAAVSEKQAAPIQTELYKVMTKLLDSVAWMAWHEGLEKTAQDYFQLALRATVASNEQLFGARILVGLAWQMYHLEQPQDALKIVQLAAKKTHGIAGPQAKAMMQMFEAWAYAALNQENKFKGKIESAQESMLQIKNNSAPYWLSYCDQAELASMTGGSLRLLAAHKPKQYAEQASEYYFKAVQARTNDIDRMNAVDYLGLAESRYLLNDIDLAVNATEKALIVYEQLQNRCGTTHRRLRKIYHYSNQPTKSEKLQTLNLKLKSILSVT